MAADLQKPLTAWHAPDKWVDRQREAWADGYNRALAITAALRAEAGAVVTEDMVRNMLHLCPTELAYPKKWRWMAENLNAALAQARRNDRE